MNSVLLSIVTPCYNHGKYLDEMVESIYSSSWPFEFEHIIVNDGSTDFLTLKKLGELENKFKLLVIHQENHGLGNARNTGISFAQGKYILPLDSDNKINLENLISAVELFETLPPDVGVVYGDAELFGDKDGPWVSGPFDRERLLKFNYIDACAIFKKSVWRHVGGYKEDMPYMGWEDWEFWLSFIENEFKFFYIPKPLFFYRVTGNSMIKSITSDALKIDILKAYVYYNHIRLFKAEDDPIKAHNEKYENYIKTILESNAYKLGNAIIKPLRYILDKLKLSY